MPRTFTSHAQIIDAIGIANLVTALELTRPHVRTLHARNSIPLRYWPRVIKCARSARISGVSLETLADIAIKSDQDANSATKKKGKPRSRKGAKVIQE